MPSAQVQDVQRDFSFGIVRGMGPQAIDPRALYDHINGFYEDDGGTYKRGGSNEYSDALASPASNPVVWVWDGFFEAGQRTVFASQSDFYTLDDSEVPINLGGPGMTVPAPAALIAGMLFLPGGYIYAGSRKTANYSTGTVTFTNGSRTVTGSGTTWNTLVDAGMLLQRGNERNYVVASIDSTTQLTLTEPYEGASGAGVAYTLRPLYQITAADPYESGAFYAAGANRLITAAGEILKFTEILKPHKWTLTAGSPPEEIPNEHTFAEGVEITGAGVIGQTVIVATTGGIWTVDGFAFDIVDAQGNTNHRVQPISRELVPVGPMASWQQSLVIPCASGIFLIDGVSAPRRISYPIDELYRVYIDRAYSAGQPAVYADHLFLPIITGSAQVRDVLTARLDRPIQIGGQPSFPWSRQQQTDADCPAFAVRHTSGAEPILLAANRGLAQITDCSGFLEPNPSNETDAAGGNFRWTKVTRDYETGSLTRNTVRTIRPRYEMTGDGAEIQFEYGYGSRQMTGPLIGQIEFGEFEFAEDEQDVWFALGSLGPSDGNDPEHIRVNEEVRFIRYRISSDSPVSSLRFRSLEQFVRRSEAVRR